MPGAMRKLGLYLGLVEDDEDRDRRYDDDSYDDDDFADDEPQGGSVRRWTADDRSPARTATLHRDAPRTRGATALDPGLRAAPAPAEDPYRITTLHPRTYNEARTIGEHFREGTPVIMNLTEMDDGDAKRLVDFAAGLIFGLRGSIERVTNKVFLLSPEHVEVTAEDKARIATGGFFNQS
ncbi:MAG TPA: cell division protein SepF [Mycobacteriales bacterium]|nr:cell division protein SepF [Mycobacteriales bacterium]